MEQSIGTRKERVLRMNYAEHSDWFSIAVAFIPIIVSEAVE